MKLRMIGLNIKNSEAFLGKTVVFVMENKILW